MAGKDITIPFGPDRTGAFDPVDTPDAPHGEGGMRSSQDPYASGSRAEESLKNETFDGFGERGAARPAAAPIIDVTGRIEQSDDAAAAGLTREEATAQGMDDVQMSFLALKNSIDQGRELKARGKQRDELKEKLDVDKAELADREHILANYAEVVAEQDELIARHTRQRDARKQELAQVAASKDETSEALERMREYHASQMEPLERELGQARANADQAKNDERSRKTELNAAESELRRAEEGQGKTLASAQHAQVEAAYEEARVRSEAAKEHLAQVQRVYDDARQQIEQSEGPLERQLADYAKNEEELKDSISRLAEEISTARHRRQYCDSVYRYPDETVKLRDSVAADEDKMRQMDEAYEALDARLSQSKAASKKAKVAIGVVIAIVVAFVIVLLVVAGR